jgi:hypothetical protein
MLKVENIFRNGDRIYGKVGEYYVSTNLTRTRDIEFHNSTYDKVYVGYIGALKEEYNIYRELLIATYFNLNY